MSHIDKGLATTRDPSSIPDYGRTLEDVIQAINTLPDLKPRAKSDLKWAIRTIARARGHHPSAVPANPPAITRALNGFQPAQLGLTPETWSNAIYLAGEALRAVGCYVAPGAYNAPLTGDWLVLAGRIENDSLRYGLSRFMRWACQNGWSPATITPAHFDRYRADLEKRLACKNPVREFRRIRLKWNKAVREVPGWPNSPVAIEKAKEGYTYPWSKFQPSLRAEITAYFDKRSKPNLFAKDYVKPLKPRTRTDNEFRIRQFASAAVRAGVEADGLAHIADLLVPDTIQRGFEFMLERSGGNVTSQILGLAHILVALAKHSGRLSRPALEAALETLELVRRDPDGRWRDRQTSMTKKNKERLRQFNDPMNIAKIVYATDILCEGLPTKGPLTFRQAELVRAALMIELELVFPIREENLATLRLDDQIQWSQAGRRGVVSIYIEAGDVKNAQELEVQLPERTARLLNFYLDYAWPVLGGGPASWLFPGEKGHLHPRGMGEQLQKVIKRKLGLVLNMHLFRHLCAKLYLDRHPGQFAIIQYALGHKDIRTTIRCYAEISNITALKLVDENLLELRAELAHLVPARKRGGGK